MIFVILLILGFKPFPANADPLAQLCQTSISYMDNSTYHASLKLLSTSLSRRASSTPTLFAKDFVRSGQGRIFGLALCQGDNNASACRSCINTASQDAWLLCRPNKDAHVLYDDCIVHISGTDITYYDPNAVLNRLMIFMDTVFAKLGPGIATEESAKYYDMRINDNIKLLLQETAKQAAYNSTTRYATGRMDVNSTFPLIYSLAQCNPDLQPNDCWDCLDNIRRMAKNFRKQQHGERIATVWCNLMYNRYQFYKGQPMQLINWSAALNQTTNMTAPETAPAPVGVPRQKDNSKPVVVPTQKHKSKQCNRFFLSRKLGHQVLPFPKTRSSSFLLF